MDHWGDPWADSADEQSAPTKNAVTSPAPASTPSAPALLNGFHDDPGWGNEDGAFGDWAASTTAAAILSAAGPSKVTRDAGNGHATDLSTASWGSDSIDPRGGTSDARASTWLSGSSAPVAEDVASETSDSSNTVHLDSASQSFADASWTRSQNDDDSSARPSTSPSLTSPRELLVESARTSLEEEQTKPVLVQRDVVRADHGSKDPAAQEDVKHTRDIKERQVPTAHIALERNGHQFGIGTADSHHGHDLENTEQEHSFGQDNSQVLHGSGSIRRTAKAGKFEADDMLLNDLFPTLRSDEPLEDAPEDPIHSTAGRRAWYRLTRKQTLREHKSGIGDDNYIRVTWANSHIRAEVNKIVGRWAREDRISGTGPGARASFYWDTPVPVVDKSASSHSRTKTAVSAPRIAAPARQSLPAIPTSVTAAFNWSSPTTSLDPWKQHVSALTSSPSPTTTEHLEQNEQESGLKLARADFAAGQERAQETASQLSIGPSETPLVTESVTTPSYNVPITSPWIATSNFDKNVATTSRNIEAAFDNDEDDDDWGEMVTSPTFAPATQTRVETRLTPPPDVKSSSSASIDTTSTPKEQSTDAMYAAPIVRLRSTISPTSAVFGRKSFVPMHVEEGPVGPGILKPAKRPVSSTSRSNAEKPRMIAPHDSVSDATFARSEEQLPSVASILEGSIPGSFHVGDSNGHDSIPVTSSASSLKPLRPSTPTAAPHDQPHPGMAQWSDADFSFFESIAPKSEPSDQPNPVPSDPFSIFGTPPRPASSTSSVKTFTRSPPRDVTPPPIQPLTGATNSAQRRKTEEEQIIKDILRGLPDMSYMLN
ncbi:hypothetical protein ACN47E_008134 [Coniothyrium glycines]